MDYILQIGCVQNYIHIVHCKATYKNDVTQSKAISVMASVSKIPLIDVKLHQPKLL